MIDQINESLITMVIVNAHRVLQYTIHDILVRVDKTAIMARISLRDPWESALQIRRRNGRIVLVVALRSNYPLPDPTSRDSVMDAVKFWILNDRPVHTLKQVGAAIFLQISPSVIFDP